MGLIIAVIAIAFLQIWGAENPLHKDGWFLQWNRFIEKHWPSADMRLVGVAAAVLPAVGLLLLLLVLKEISMWLLLPVGVIVLLYSFGRGEFSSIVSEYTKACSIEDWESAKARAERFEVPVDDVALNDWNALHEHVFQEAGYRGFERLFAVLFWFGLLGPVGALLYRLAFLRLHKVRADDDYAAQLLWLLEWPAVRVLGFSFAVTGNFVGCYHRWKECLLCVRRQTVAVLSPLILGALSVDDGLSQTCEVTRTELDLMHRLYQRTLWFWMAAASFVMVMW